MRKQKERLHSVKLHGEEYPVQVIKSSRKSMAIEIRPDLLVLVRVPFAVSEEMVVCFLQKHQEWIEKKIKLMRQKKEEQPEADPLSMEEIKQLADGAARVIPEKASYFARMINVTYGKITIRNQKTRWGSCSAKGNLNFNCLLMFAPEEVLDYVVVHELCHRKEMNHSKAFWNLVEGVLPDYRERRRWLKEHGEELMRRMHSN